MCTDTVYHPYYLYYTMHLLMASAIFCPSIVEPSIPHSWPIQSLFLHKQSRKKHPFIPSTIISWIHSMNPMNPKPHFFSLFASFISNSVKISSRRSKLISSFTVLFLLIPVFIFILVNSLILLLLLLLLLLLFALTILIILITVLIAMTAKARKLKGENDEVEEHCDRASNVSAISKLWRSCSWRPKHKKSAWFFKKSRL